MKITATMFDMLKQIDEWCVKHTGAPHSVLSPRTFRALENRGLVEHVDAHHGVRLTDAGLKIVKDNEYADLVTRRFLGES